MIRMRMQMRMRALRERRDAGVAMIFVIAIGLIVTILATTMLVNVLADQTSARTQRNVTSAEGAAEAGLQDAVFQLGQYNAAGQSNWSSLPNSWTPAVPHTQSFGTNARYAVSLTSQPGTSNLIVKSTGTYGSNTRTIRAVVKQAYPPAFDYSLFGSSGIDIHHHSSWLSPQVWTTSVHSNGYINLDYSADFTVQNMEAVGKITMQKGGGSDPGGSIPTTGYSWYDALNGKCFPGGMNSPGGVAPASGTTTCSSCPNATYCYSGNATVRGNISAGSVVVGSRGQVLPTSSMLLDTGLTIPAESGDVTAQSATINGTTYSTALAAANCNASTGNCKKGTAATAGQIGGTLNIQSTDPVSSVPFPSINYSSTYRTLAQKEQGATVPPPAGGQHVFAGSGDFLSYITDPANGFYRTISPTDGSLGQWTGASQGTPPVIYLNGDYDITGGSLQLNYGSLKGMANAATGTTGPAPLIVIQGSLVVETGSITLNSGLVMVGAGNRTDFLTPGTATTPIAINTSRLLDPHATGPAVLAAGGQIQSTDYDTDSPWTSGATYEPAKATPVYIRGLVYSAVWNAKTSTSTPQNQHWHNFDPKNLMKIYGAQVGGDLHDCNNFSFSYDPLVRLAFGFSGGTVQIVDYQELGK